MIFRVEVCLIFPTSLKPVSSPHLARLSCFGLCHPYQVYKASLVLRIGKGALTITSIGSTTDDAKVFRSSGITSKRSEDSRRAHVGK